MRNPLSTLELTTWLEQQPADKEYDYTDNKGCLIHQYLKAKGFNVGSVNPARWSEPADKDLNYKRHALPHNWNDISNGFPHTFGAALKRAKAL